LGKGSLWDWVKKTAKDNFSTALLSPVANLKYLPNPFKNGNSFLPSFFSGSSAGDQLFPFPFFPSNFFLTPLSFSFGEVQLPSLGTSIAEEREWWGTGLLLLGVKGG